MRFALMMVGIMIVKTKGNIEERIKDKTKSRNVPTEKDCSFSPLRFKTVA